jgi:hypothetical protein
MGICMIYWCMEPVKILLNSRPQGGLWQTALNQYKMRKSRPRAAIQPLLVFNMAPAAVRHMYTAKCKKIACIFFRILGKLCDFLHCKRDYSLFGTWLGQDQDYLGKSPEWLYRNLRFSKRATVGVRATYATRLNSGMKRVKCGWTQPLFHKVSNHWFSGRNLKG